MTQLTAVQQISKAGYNSLSRHTTDTLLLTFNGVSITPITAQTITLLRNLCPFALHDHCSQTESMSSYTTVCSVREYVFYVFCQISKKHDFLRFLK